MIKSAEQYAVHALLSHESNLLYRVPAYQREYSWTKHEWDELFDDLVQAEGPHFLGTIICLDKSLDALKAVVFELVDGQQRMTTLSLLMAAVYSLMSEAKDELDV